MKKLSIQEVKERSEELDLSPAFIRDVEAGNIELYRYKTKDEKGELLRQDWMYHSAGDCIIGLRINGVKLGWA